MFPQIHTDKPNLLDLFQIWLNLPARSKHVAPHFKMLWAEDSVSYEYPSAGGDDGKVRVTTVAGAVDKDPEGNPGRAPVSPPPDSWAANPDNHVAIWTISIDAGASWTLPAAPAFCTRSLFFYEGDQLQIAPADGSEAAQVIKGQKNLHLKPDVAAVLTNPSKSGTTELLMLQGRPIDEPVAQHGPFVMNTREEIMQAFMDYQR